MLIFQALIQTQYLVSSGLETISITSGASSTDSNLLFKYVDSSYIH